MLDGAELANTAKHAPELIDMDKVRYAGRIIENFQSFLDGLTSVQIREYGKTTLIFEVPSYTANTVLGYKYSDD